MLGTRFVGAATRRFGIGPPIVGSYYLAAPATLMIPLAGGPSWLAFSMLLFDQLFGGTMWMVDNVSATSLRQAVTSQDLLGRVNASFLAANSGLRPLGTLAAGACAAAIGVQEATFIAVAGINAAGLWLLSPAVRGRKTPLTGAGI